MSYQHLILSLGTLLCQQSAVPASHGKGQLSPM